MRQLFAVLLVGLCFSAHADQVLILSGGGSPNSNHYSQYLQTKTLTDQLRVMQPGLPIDVMFGQGNNTSETPLIADVHREVHANGHTREVMLAGVINGNHPATVANVNAYFSQGRPATLGSNETLFMIVSDHGFPQRDQTGHDDPSYSNNCMDLWGFEGNVTNQSYRVASNSERCFPKNQLQDHLLNHVHAQRTVFAMSQCFSGGFHKMSVDLSGAYPTANPRICGFTAITEDTTASGCTPDVDGPGYQGYERSFTQQLTGVDVVSGARLRPAKDSLMSAHREAAVEDLTKDIPLSTSDFYLWKWALAIDADTFQPRTSNVNMQTVREIMNATTIGGHRVGDLDYFSKENFFSRVRAKVLEVQPQDAAAVMGTLAEHKALVEDLTRQNERYGAEMDRLYTVQNADVRTVLTRWSQFVQSGRSHVTPMEARIETNFFNVIDAQNGFGSSYPAAIYTMALLTLNDSARADALSDYKHQRKLYAIDWALSSGDAELTAVAQRLQNTERELDQVGQQQFELEKRHGQIRRLLIYRQVLGAWNALTQMHDQTALNELKALIACEATKFSH